MAAPFKACTIRKSFGPNMEHRYIVQLDQDAAEIMGETRMRYVYQSKIGAERFAATLQANFDAAHDDAMHA